MKCKLTRHFVQPAVPFRQPAASLRQPGELLRQPGAALRQPDYIKSSTHQPNNYKSLYCDESQYHYDLISERWAISRHSVLIYPLNF